MYKRSTKAHMCNNTSFTTSSLTRRPFPRLLPSQDYFNQYCGGSDLAESLPIREKNGLAVFLPVLRAKLKFHLVRFFFHPFQVDKISISLAMESIYLTFLSSQNYWSCAKFLNIYMNIYIHSCRSICLCVSDWVNSKQWFEPWRTMKQCFQPWLSWITHNS